MNMNAKKSLGQNFLHDQSVLKKIADSIETTDKDLIIEIGSGKGALTNYLIHKNSQILAYEIDQRMEEILNRFSIPVIYDDFLNRDLLSDLKEFSYANLYVMANIPYYITTPIIEHIIKSNLIVNKMTLLVQDEVANRFTAKPRSKNYGYITLFLGYYFKMTKLLFVPNTAFEPIPKVNSAVVLFERKDALDVDVKKYFKFLKNAFQQKRKTLKNNLKDYDWNFIESILKEHGYGATVRAEELPEDIFIDIVNKLG